MSPILRNIVALLPFSLTFNVIDEPQQVLVQASSYKLAKSYTGKSFFDGFDWKTFDDPTHGRVNYVSETDARNKNLSYVSDHNTFVMRTDYKHKVQPGQRGRDSVRIESKDTFGNGIFIADIQHMPVGCGTWPAFWTSTTDQWPNGGEIDIIEGVNGRGTNQGTLHTTPGCTIPKNVDESGQQLSSDCAVHGSDNQGCGVKDNRRDSFGPAFNKISGGWYVMKRSDTGIKMWFWPRGGHAPADVRTGAAHVDPAHFGKPFANFPSTQCNMKEHFGQHRIIFDNTLCGDWAGAVYGQQGCPSTCEDHVMNNPDAFKDAYWKVRALRVYELKSQTSEDEDEAAVNDGYEYEYEDVDYSVDDMVVVV
ncbi:uncharacterized protein IL334_000803 [Kwoniella shivajii]|uniref:GH16 domain-containing protein n=1 Tax=Kwoniella shivajii TaxID=564305 RepID=A0ABZ1CQ73_9TREE|nr:hypothetical protein IL334_000803 [Kwoniella shivajii]